MRRTATAVAERRAPEPWRAVKTYASWDEADAQRSATLRDNPTLDVRLDPQHGQFVLQVRRSAP